MTSISLALHRRCTLSVASISLLIAGCGGSDTLDVSAATQVKSVDTRPTEANASGTADTSAATLAAASTAKQLAATLGARASESSTAPVTKSVATTPAKTSTTTTTASPVETAADLSALPLVQPRHLKYVGAFRFPQTSGADVCESFAYGGIALTFNPAGNGGAGSLLATGHNYCSRVAEFTIPELGTAASYTDLKHARMLQPATQGRMVDSLEGKLTTSGISGGTHNTVNGLLVYRNQLAISGGNSYTYSQPVSHWSRPLDLAVRGQVSDAVAVSGDAGYPAARFTAGYMCHVPANLQGALGAPALTGWVADSIVSASSSGPAAFAFDPARLAPAAGGVVPAKTLLFYPVSAPLEESVPGQIQQMWNWTSIPRGCAVPDGTRTVMFVGRHGTGEFQYGVGGENGHTNQTPQVPIYDPSDNSTGEHAWPYRYQVWAYDAADLVKVSKGVLKPYQARPYASWSIDMPYVGPAGSHSLGGIAYDPKSRRLFIVQGNAGKAGEPLIHAFQVDNAISTAPQY